MPKPKPTGSAPSPSEAPADPREAVRDAAAVAIRAGDDALARMLLDALEATEVRAAPVLELVRGGSGAPGGDR